jgi:hypothetical protein
MRAMNEPKMSRAVNPIICTLQAIGRRDQARKRCRDHVATTRRAKAAGEGQGGGQRNQDEHAEVKFSESADQAGESQQNHVRPDLPRKENTLIATRCNQV